MAREVDLDVFVAAWSAGAAVLDVREPEEYRLGHVPGARLAATGLDALSVAGGIRGWAGGGRPVVAWSAPGPV
ncbi:rhodanese-like domain-containing protein [Streptomyces antibioticus]|uniref:rhodanese-like domain-containing protein n=1 Tax=Streptomyces antibioticus TaxID=1890 RepID=UPI0033EDA248